MPTGSRFECPASPDGAKAASGIGRSAFWSLPASATREAMEASAIAWADTGAENEGGGALPPHAISRGRASPNIDNRAIMVLPFGH